MKDKRFIDELVSRLEEAREKVQNNLRDLDHNELNWKQDPESWSVGQCLDHLIVSDCTYFPQLKKLTEGKSAMSLWQKWSPFSGLFGKMLVSQVKEIPVRKMKAPKIFVPSSSKIDMGVYERFFKHLDSLREYISLSAAFDLDRTRLSSPVSSFITYSLRNAYLLLVQHEHRHINQAIRVKEKLQKTKTNPGVQNAPV